MKPPLDQNALLYLAAIGGPLLLLGLVVFFTRHRRPASRGRGYSYGKMAAPVALERPRSTLPAPRPESLPPRTTPVSGEFHTARVISAISNWTPQAPRPS